MQESNKQTARQFIDALGSGNIDVLKEIMDPGIKAVSTGTSVTSMTRSYDEILQIGAGLNMLAPNGLNPEVVSMTAEDDRVAVEWKGTAKLVNDADYNNEYFMLFRIRDGKIYELREYFDTKLTDEVLVPLMSQNG